MKKIETTVKEMIETIERFQYVSFDVFDTLIFRTVSSPDKILDLAILKYQEIYGNSIKTFKIKRQYAENFSRKYYSREVNIDEIYDFLDLKDEIADRFKEIEKNIEVKNCIPNLPMISVLKECRKRGKKIVITSDMYLTSDVFDEIFNKIGITYDYLFISGEVKKTKRQGNLFPYLLNKLNIESSQIAHIGDDIHSDISMPRKYGICSLERLKYTSANFESYNTKSDVASDQLEQLYSYSVSEMGAETPEFRVGYNVVGPFLFSFCHWIHLKKVEKHIDVLFFVAREGFLIKKIYDILFPNDETQYVRLNKNLLRLPSLDNGDIVENFILSLPPRKSYRFDDLSTLLGVGNKEALVYFLNDKFSEMDYEKSINSEDLHGDKYELVAAMVDFQKVYIAEQKKCLFDYLISAGAKGKKVGMVNNSMQGSGQFLLENICSRNNFDIDIVGLQFAYTQTCKNRLGNRYCAFFDSPRLYSICNYIFCNFCLLVEHLLFEPEGTALHFRMTNGLVNVICDEPGVEKKDFAVIEKIQLASIKFAMHAKDFLVADVLNCSVAAMMNLFLLPKKEDANLLGNLWDKDIDRVKIINDIERKFSLTELLLKHKPNALEWVEGYISSEDFSQKWKDIFRIKKIILNYTKHKSLVLLDIELCFYNKICFALNKLLRAFLKIKYVFLFHLFKIKPRRK